MTRAADAAATLADRLRALGHEPVVVPLLRLVPVDGALRDVAADVVVLTSATAVDRLVAERPGWQPDLVACVGPSTARRAREAGLRVDVVPGDADGVALAGALGDRRGQRVLWPRAEEATPGTSEGLRATGADVVEVVAYRNEIPEDAADRLRTSRPVDVATLLSPSAAKALAGLLDAAGLPRPPVVVIGPTTAEAARQAGFDVVGVATSPTAEGVADAVAAVPPRPPARKA